MFATRCVALNLGRLKIKMSGNSRSIFKLFNRWAVVASLVAAIFSGIAFEAESFWLSLATIIVGWLLIASQLIRLIHKLPRVNNSESRTRFNLIRFAKMILIFMTITITLATVYWSWINIRKIMPPDNAIQLPVGEYAGITIVVDPGSSWEHGGVIHEKIDRTSLTQTITPRNQIYPRLIRTGSLSVIRIMLIGKRSDEPIHVSNQIPIRIASYKPIADVVDIASPTGIGGGGGGDAWLMVAEVSSHTIKQFNDKTIWARYPSNLKEQLVDVGSVSDLRWPREVVKAIESTPEDLPDYFLLNKNDVIVIDVAIMFKTPGVYQLQFGAEYVYKGHRSIAWARPPIEVYALKDFYNWVESLTSSSQNEFYLDAICKLHPKNPSYGHGCISVVNVSSNEPKSLTSNVAFSQDGAFLAAGFSDGSATIWDALTGRELKTFHDIQHVGKVNKVAISKDGTLLAIAREVVELWDTRSNKSTTLPYVNLAEINDITFSDSEPILAAASHGITLWDTRSQSRLHTFNEDNGWVLSIAFSPDGRILASGNSNGSLILWDVAGRRVLRKLGNGLGFIRAIKFTSDGRKLASASDNGTVKVWEVATGKEMRSYTTNSEFASSVSFSPNGNFLSASVGGEGIVWDESTGELIHTFSFQTGGISSVVFSSDGSKVATGGVEGIRIWRVIGWDELLEISLDPYSIKPSTSP